MPHHRAGRSIRDVAQRSSRWFVGFRFALVLLVIVAANARGQNALSDLPPLHMRDQSIELSMKIKEPFTLVSVGDMLQMNPISKSDDPDVQYLVKLMREADMTTANNENTVLDHDTFTGQISHMEAPTVVADDWAGMGIKMMTKANNHTFDDGDAGLWADFHELDRVGIVHVGVDRDLAEARLARYYTTPKGTVAMVGVYAHSAELNAIPTGKTVIVTAEQLKQLRAMRDSIVARRGEVENPIMVPPHDPDGETSIWGLIFKLADAPDKPIPSGDADMDQALARYHDRVKSSAPIPSKINILGLTNYIGVTAAQLAQLRGIANDKGSGDTLSAFGLNFKVTPGAGEYHYVVNPDDEREILREIRTGKQFSDFEVVQIHWHQNRYAFQHYSFDHYPADFETKFAHDAIDQGADVFVGHGVHTIKGIEIYKGRPIFYGISNFVMQQQIFHSWRDFGSQLPLAPTGPIVGEGEDNERHWAWMEHADNFEALLTRCRYENGKLTEVRIYPVDVGGPDRPGSQLGIPKRPTPAVAHRMLEELVKYSKPFGTKIDIEDGTGVIRIAPDERTK